MTEVEWWDFDDADEMAEAVAGDIAFIIESALDARGNATVAFPGGNTPKPVFAKLAEKQLRWKHVTIVPTDDRLVAVDSPLSNVAVLAKAFLPLGARVVPIASADAADHRLAGNAANARLGDLAFPLDLVWLGMGSDGHVASIFAGPDLEEALAGPKDRRATGVLPDPMPADAAVARVTLTAAAIAQARTVLFTIAGGDKRTLLERAIEDGEASTLPVGRLFAQLSVPVDIYAAA